MPLNDADRDKLEQIERGLARPAATKRRSAG